MKYYVFCSRYILFERKAKHWKEFYSEPVALLFMKVNGYKLIAKGK